MADSGPACSSSRATSFQSTARNQRPSGRLLQRRDCAEGNDVVVVSNDLWRKRLGADPTIVGKPLRINERPLTVIGVAQAHISAQVDGSLAWVPYTFDRLSR
jgi:hypothetical protein